MYPERKRGLSYSAAFHIFVLLLIVFGLPQLAPEIKDEQEIEITLMPAPITEKSNIPISQQTPTPSKEPPKPEPPAPVPPKPVKPEPPKPAPPTPPAHSEPPPPPPPPEPKPAPKPIVKPEPPKPAPPKPVEPPKPQPPKPQPPKPKPPKPKPPKATEDDLQDVLNNLAKEAQASKPDEKPAKPAKPKAASSASSSTHSSHFDPSQQISADVRSAIMSQLAQCWSPPMGVKDAHSLVVVVNADFNADGSVIAGSVKLSHGNSSDPLYAAAADAARRAVLECSPLKDLPADKYNGWKSMELRFDPKNML